MKYFIIAGEASGDLHAANLVAHLKKKDSFAHIEGWGGDNLLKEEVYIHKHIRELAFMGFVEVLKNLRTILKNFIICKEQIKSFNPDVVVLVDYPGFNLRMAKWAKQNKYLVVYYISPTIWAWNESRVFTIKRYVDRMICILPFEKAYYAKWDYAADYVGNPSVEVIRKEIDKRNPLSFTKKVIALLPGSRKQEIEMILPTMLKAIENFSDYDIVISQSPNLEKSLYERFLSSYPSVQLIQHQTYQILKLASAAIVTSGTATLETALFGVPQLVCYKANTASYHIAKRLIKVKYISLVNLILDKMSIVELIQKDMNIKNIQIELRKLLEDKTRISEIKKDYETLSNMLSEGDANERAAEIVYQSVLEKELKNNQY
ncbi:MAG: lipid-A-disaccharide synthase [Chitinophagaceae bacterium]|nr:lipid-A-disaccharide synthase [Chitinophagaceae bacterium]